MIALGIDIAKKNFEVAVWSDTKSRSRNYPNTPEGFTALLESLQGQDVHACLEATGRYGDALARALHEAGHKVSVVNPFAIQRYAASKLRRIKSDSVDAKLLAEYCAKEQPRAWTPPKQEQAELQELTRRLEGFQEMLQMERNRLKSGGQAAAVIQLTKQSIASLSKLVEQTKRLIQQHIDAHKELKRQRELLVSIPGVGKHTASVLLAEVGEVGRYASAKQLAAYAGVCPRERSSGEWKGKTLMSKMGNSRLRKALYLPAVVAKNHNPVVKEFAERLEKKGKPKMLVVGAAMRKLLHIAYGVLKHDRPFDAHATEATTRARLEVLSTAERDLRRAKKIA